MAGIEMGFSFLNRLPISHFRGASPPPTRTIFKRGNQNEKTFTITQCVFKQSFELRQEQVHSQVESKPIQEGETLTQMEHRIQVSPF